MPSLWFWIKWLFADQFVPTNELELIEIAVNYGWHRKNYRYFLEYEKTFGVESVRNFWGSVAYWIKFLKKDGYGNWSPIEINGEILHNPTISDFMLPYYKADSLAQKIFSVDDKIITFALDLGEQDKQDIIDYVKLHWIGGITV